MRTQPNPQGATLAEHAGWRDSASLPSSVDAALTLLQEQEAVAFIPLFGPNPMTESPSNTVMVPMLPIPAPLPPADLPAVHVMDPPLSSQPSQQPIPKSVPPATPPLTSPFPVTPAPLQPSTMVIGRSPKHSLLWVGEILGVLPSDRAAEGDVRYEVYAWGSHQRYVLSCRQWAPGYYSSGGGYVSYDKRASKRVAEIVELSHGQIAAAGFEMERSRGNRESCLSPSLCSHFTSGSDGCHFYEYPGAHLFNPSVASAVTFLASIDLSVRAATTHGPVSLKHLYPASRQLVCFADQKEDQGWIDREVYIRTPISEVPRNVPCVPLLRVHTEKLQDDGTCKFKTCTIINGKQVPREGLSVAT
uniref:Uncharacterized protein n=1 Tax=Chromera velia CCMP2878 TaxID=1169474 RepID=A0A0G4F1A4_9ALVE|eukprot:Cvel_14689.t1-p1 / transcript=Cvel_14689.t1 / gene=Cvel_14689 / organism=Chromera_velia_CCMP2878 / gene_product=hypothetical protein / transcript_product=hypothetical protein / location=Cvel_scaffold1054:7643-8719(-) / protein_length=359 / sequence_SO=supercontig / SO=protein_coding / is_pseudo=false